MKHLEGKSLTEMYIWYKESWSQMTEVEQALFVHWDCNSAYYQVNDSLKRGGMKPITESEYINHFEYLDRTYAS